MDAENVKQKEMEERTLIVPYGDFVDGIQAMADLDSIRALITTEAAYASDSILAILGLIASTEEEDA